MREIGTRNGVMVGWRISYCGNVIYKLLNVTCILFFMLKIFILKIYSRDLFAGARAAHGAGARARAAGSRGGTAALSTGESAGTFLGSGSSLASFGHFYI